MGTVTAGAREGGGGGGGQEEVRVGHAAVKAEGAGRKGEEQREPRATRPRADPSNPAECHQAGTSVVANILEVSEEEEEGAGRMVVAGG